MGYSFKAVESLLSRARQHLKEVLTQMEIASSTSPAELTTLLNTVVQMLDTQVKRCLAYGMQREAVLFAQSAQLLIELASKTIGETALDGRRKNAKSVGTSHSPIHLVTLSPIHLVTLSCSQPFAKSSTDVL